MIQGKTIISDEVFVDIVRAAAQDLGHVTLSLNEGSSLFSLAKRVTDKMVPQISVRKSDTTVDENGTVTKGHVSFELKVAVEYGSNIPEVVENLRQAIVKEVAALTDFYVDSVDVVVARLVNIQKEAAPLVTAQEKAAHPEAEKESPPAQEKKMDLHLIA